MVNYVVPEGYELIKNDNVLTYYKENKIAGSYCNFFVYKLVPGKANVQQDFDFAWDNLVQKPFKVPGISNMQPAASLKGWQFLTGTAKYFDNGIAAQAMLITCSGGNNTQSICILSNADKYKNDIESFIASFDVTQEMAAASNTPSAASSYNKTNPSSAGNIKYEVWECNCTNLATGTLVTTKLNTVVLSADGKCLYFMPAKGLNGVTPANSNQDGSWGKVTDKGNTLKLENDKYGNMELYKITSTSMSRYPNSTSSIYKKVKDIDGLRFEGAYSPELSYYNGKTDVISRQIDPQKRPIIFFKKDGTYINEGIAFSNLTLDDDFAIGRGTYEIVNYSLILTTQTGRKLQVAFTPVLDATPVNNDNSGLIINNNLFYGLDKTFAPHN